MFPIVLSLILACSTEPTPAPPVAEPEVEAEPEIAPEVEPAEAELENEPEQQPEEVAEAETEAEAVAAAEPEEEAEPEPEPEAVATAEPEPEAEPVAAAEPSAEPAEEPEPVPAAVASTYTVNAGNSSLYVQVFKDADTMGAGLSHDHVMLARGWSGTVRWHPSDASECLIEVSLPVSKLAVDTASMRSAVGYDSELSDSQRETVKKNMLARDQLDAGSHPNITFRSTSCSGTTGTVQVTGSLSIRGVSKQITVPLSVSLDGGFSARGSFRARHSDFGFQPYTAMMGALKNRDQMTFTIKLASQ
jgi:polyisoprenoid-binding protein YceI